MFNKLTHKVFGGLKMTWPRVIIFAVIMGVYTALCALLAPDGNSFHDIAVVMSPWVLPALIVILNCKTPWEAAAKVFVFFLISQPLVYLIQVPFSDMGWKQIAYWDAHKRELSVYALRNHYDTTWDRRVLDGKVDSYPLIPWKKECGMCAAWCEIPAMPKKWED